MRVNYVLMPVDHGNISGLYILFGFGLPLYIIYLICRVYLCDLSRIIQLFTEFYSANYQHFTSFDILL